MQPIRTGIFDLFTIGPGPSSSHTIGPMRAGHRFLQVLRGLDGDALARATGVTARLFGSLSATGRGHGTDRALVAGLLGHRPEEVEQAFLEELAMHPSQPRRIPLEGADLTVSVDGVVFGAVEGHGHPCSNTLVLTLDGPDGPLLERTYHSVGGGSVTSPDEPEEAAGDPAYPYADMDGLKAHIQATGQRLHRIILDNEAAITGRSEAEVLGELDRIMEAMRQSVERGLAEEGVLPGELRLARKAPELYRRGRAAAPASDRFLHQLNAYAFAVAEENAAGHVVVTAPTSGSAGVIPAVLHALREHLDIPREALREGMLAAAAVGFLAKNNASIAGAEVGCQGEIGVASAMAAALIAYARGHNYRVAENAAETALEHHLGLTCDPVGGYVQIPCIERNAMGAVKAYNAALIATIQNPDKHKVNLDRCIRAMAATGRDLHAKYRETSLGGLALSLTEC
ncbi:L-serine ammonia-lyase [Desulfohalovibrio reitneri]|uniref:L-serine ammonia-lyase n=1 Tax=Desulfohalovibrio reitneri TaxID=1307759 RepID=UPI0004A76A68|nr:L-serine ammonia-lyase [Desulfohalovibrio reitneri]